MRYEEFTIEGRNAVIEAFRAGKTIDKLLILDGAQDGPIQTIKREARKHDTIVKYVTSERLDQLSETGKHQGVIAYMAAYKYAQVEDILAIAREKDEPPFVILLDNIEDPHNLRHYPKEPRGRADRDGGEGVCGCAELYPRGKSDEFVKDDGGAEKGGAVVCVRRYGRHLHVSA